MVAVECGVALCAAVDWHRAAHPGAEFGDPLKKPAQDQSVIRFEVAPRSIAMILATIAGVWLAYKLWIVELILVMALILAGTFNPVIEWLETHGLKTRVRPGPLLCHEERRRGGSAVPHAATAC
jgi:hypothetical protein